MFLTGRRIVGELGARRRFTAVKWNSLYTSQVKPPAFVARKIAKYAALTTLVVGGTFLGVSYSYFEHIVSIIVAREYLSIEELQQYHELKHNLLGDEHTALNNLWSKYWRIYSRYKQYTEPFIVSRGTHFTDSYRSELRRKVKRELLVKRKRAMETGDFGDDFVVSLGYVTLMLTDQEMEVVGKILKLVDISAKREFVNQGECESEDSRS